MQRASGSSFERLSLWSLYSFAAHGWKGISIPVAGRSTFCRNALGSHAPDRSGFPSAAFGTGPAGGHPLRCIGPPSPIYSLPCPISAGETTEIPQPTRHVEKAILAVEKIRFIIDPLQKIPRK